MPGSAAEYIVYDPLNRPVLSQNGNLRTLDKWAFVKYDLKGRAVMKGFYKNTSQTSQAAMQILLDGLYSSSNSNYPESAYYEDRGTLLHGYTNRSFPKINSDNTTAIEVVSVNYYDDYDFNYDTSHVNDFSFIPQGTGEDAAITDVRDLPTGSKVIILGTTSWLYNVIFYNKFKRVIQIIANNHLRSDIDNSVTFVYDHYKGVLLKQKSFHNAGSGKVTTVVNQYEYDQTGRLTKVFQNNDDAPVDQLVAQYEYNELGQLVDKKLHNTGGSNFLQSVDYRYNIRGWLKSINNTELNINNANNDDVNDYFGLEYFYADVEGDLANAPLYNGNISAIKWKGIGAEQGITEQRAYKYVYDKSDRLTSAAYRVREESNYNQEIDAQNETVGYDMNGNITTLARNQRKHQLSGNEAFYISETIDNLSYSYNVTNGNRLDKVEDASGSASGFNNGATNNQEYDYDSDGSVKSDANKGISDIVYNEISKPIQILFTDGRKLEYTYDAVGSKLTMKTFASGNPSPVLTTDYIGGFVYENNVLSFFTMQEGRVVKNGSNLEYQYAIQDNQGNTRILFTSAAQTPVAPEATFEGDSNDKASEYLNLIPEKVVPFPTANHTPGGNKVVRMNQNYKVGPAKSIKIYPGDAVDMEVWTYFESSGGYGTENATLGALVDAVAGAFGGLNGGGGESGTIFNSVNTAFTSFGSGGNQGDYSPAAYLNYIQFDKNFNVLDAGWTVVPDSANFAKQKISVPTRHIKEEGYMYVYLSYENESDNYVYFDDFKVTHTKTAVIQYNEYYPFGLQTSNSWTRENNSNNFLYNQSTELNPTTGLYDLAFRNYDPILGRLHQVDPLAAQFTSNSPYSYSNNNPIFWNDPDGDSYLSELHKILYAKFNGLPYDENSDDAANLWLYGPSGGSAGGTVSIYLGDEAIVIDWANVPAEGFTFTNDGSGWVGQTNVRGPGGTYYYSETYGFIFMDKTYGKGIGFGERFVPIGVAQEGNQFPAFSTLWSNYPHDVNGEHQHPSDNPLYTNQCAIRLSEALVKSGVSLTGYPKEDLDKDKGRWALSANRLKYYLSQRYPDFVRVSQDVFEEKYWNKTGIIYIAPPAGALGHMDLFNKGDTGSGYYLGTEIWFWEIK